MRTLRRLLLSGPFLFALLCAALPAHATMQIPERLVIDGVAYDLHTLPLEPLLNDSATAERLAIGTGLCSGSWRNYRGTWTIEGGRLYLRALHVAPCSDPGIPIPLDTVSPGVSGSVHATWFTGQLMVVPDPERPAVYFGTPQKGFAYRVIRVEAGDVVADLPPPAQP